MNAEADSLDTRGWKPDAAELDSSANSVVYLARRDGEVAVLKVSRAWRPDAERYQRFVAEIETLEALGDNPGVMPVLDSSVPEPTRGQYPWYVMPEGRPLSKLPLSASLDDIVPALASIAATLRDMHARGYSHRDVKPQNLFEMPDGSYVVGDLGLVAVPEEIRRSLTQEGASVGPANFMAPEMREYEPGTDANPADVYSLSKTLWALAAGKKYPDLGHQRADDRGSLVAITGDDRAASLDELIERATDHEPGPRPSMEEVASELQAWVDAYSAVDHADTEGDELASAIARARERLSDQRSNAEVAAANQESAFRAFSRLEVEMGPVLGALPQIGATSNTARDHQMLDATLGHPFLEEMGRPGIVTRSALFAYTDVGDEANGVRLAVALALALQDDDVVVCAVGMLVYTLPPTLGGAYFSWSEHAEAPVGSLAVDQETARLAEAARQQLPAAIAAFTDKAENL